jgi:hypothetical protein
MRRFYGKTRYELNSTGILTKNNLEFSLAQNAMTYNRVILELK